MELMPAQELVVNNTYTKFHKNSKSFCHCYYIRDGWKMDVFSMAGMYCLLYRRLKSKKWYLVTT